MNTIFHSEAIRTIKKVNDLKNNFSGKRIIITGAGGFLGANFIHFFLCLNDELEEKCTVLAYDNFKLGRPDWLSLLEGRTDLHIRERDVIEERAYEPCDYIIHAASIASPSFYRKYPIETMDVNVLGTRNILEFSREHPVISVLYLSSSEVYGNPSRDMIPTPENYVGMVNPIGPRACYDESKRYAETLCVNFHRRHNIPVKIVRPFNVYGVGLKPEDRRVISDLFRDALTGDTVKLYSDGKATRTFCYISDAINGFIRALLIGEDGGVYNIGNNGPEISMTDLAEKIILVTGSDKRIEYCTSEDPDYLTDNPDRRCPDLSKAKKMLDYIPQTSLDEGLQQCFSYYKSIL